VTQRERIGRKCAICDKTTGSTYGFKTILRILGLPNWVDDKAHKECVRQLAQKLDIKLVADQYTLMSKAQLLAVARDRKLPLPPNWTKTQLANHLRQSDAFRDTWNRTVQSHD